MKNKIPPMYATALALIFVCPPAAQAETDSSGTVSNEPIEFVIPDNTETASTNNESSVADTEDGSDESFQITEETKSTGDEEIFIVQPQFTVTSEQDRGYYSANSISATRTNALVKNTPISISVINEELIEDLNILNDQDLVRASASISQDPDGFSLNQLRIRGFRSLTQRYDLFWREITRDSYNIQRVDVVKGANSLIYGQADPGGQINSVPKLAQIGNDFATIKGTVGNKDYRRAEFDANYTVNDKLAVRLMGVEFTRDLDQLYEYADITGATIETSFQPTENTLLRARFEYIELDQNLAPNMFESTNADSRFAPNSPQDDLSGAANSFTLGTFRNEYLYNQDAIDYIPDEIIRDLQLSQGFADILNGDRDMNNMPIPGTGNTKVTRRLLERLYAPWDSDENLYSVTGPDKFNQRKGLVSTIDWTQRISDSLQAKIAYNREDVDRESLARDGFSAGRVQSDAGGDRPYDPYVSTYWRKQDGKTLFNALKSTLLWEFELDTQIPLIAESEHKFIFGADWDRLERNPKEYEQVKDTALLRDGKYYRGNDLLNETFYLSDGFGPDTPNIRYNGRDDLFVLRQDNELEVETGALWFAAQSSFLDGRLRTLAGVRYDDIDIEYSIQDYKFGVNDNFVNNNLDGDYSRAVTSIQDAKNSYDQFSPTIGVLFWVTDNLAVFANYAQSIQSPTNIDVDPLGNIIPPVYGEGYEYGIRFDLFDGKLNGQITSFYIEKENDNIVNYDFRLADIYTFEEFGESNPEIFNPNGTLNNNLLPGKQIAGDVSRSEGIEVEFYYNPNRNLSFILSYTYNNLDAIKINENVNPRFAQVFGQAPHNLLLIGRYKFTDGPLRGLTVGANQRFRSSSIIGQWYIEDDNDAAGQGTWYDIKYDPEFVTDVFFSYQKKIGSGRGAPILNLGLRVNNLWDTTDLIQRNTSAFYRPSRQYLLSASMKF